jgi:hypothetical protein
MSERDPTLREQIFAVCHACNPDINVLVQTLVDCLMISIIAVSRDADTAELNLRRITEDMLVRIREAYREYHDMAAAQRGTRQ